MRFLVAYDIADPRRLRRVARACERQALRLQKSVFLFEGTKAELENLLLKLSGLIDPQEDVVQSWELDRRESPNGRIQGQGMQVQPAAVVLDRNDWWFVDNDGSGPSLPGRRSSS